jgi:anti-sigma regulatory factor (Ser/Thr protein kinase)
MVDMAEFGRNPGALLGRFHRFLGEDGERPCRIVGEPVWPERTPDEYAACVQHEALLNSAFSGRRVTVLCPYDAAALNAAVLADVVATHPVVRQHGAETASSGYAPEETLDRHNTPLAPGEDAESFEVPDVGAVPHARRFATERARRAGLSGERVDDVELVVHELVANSIEHTGGRCSLAVWPEGAEMVCLVSDAGVFADPLAGRRWPHPDQPRARGLYLVNHLANLVRIHTTPTGTTVLARL